MSIEEPEAKEVSPNHAGCEEHRRLLDQLGAAVRELLRLHQEQFQAIVQGESECS